MRKYLIASIILTGAVYLAACKQSPANSTKKSVLYVTAAKGLNIREKPSADSKRVGGLANGAQVTVLNRQPDPVTIGGSSGHWTKVKSAAGTGWVFGAYLSSTKPAPQADPASGKPSGPVFGQYESDCDPDVTLNFNSGNKVEVNTNVCEGYQREIWTYSQTGADVKLGTKDVSDNFRVLPDGNLEYRPKEYSMITCGNCKKGDIWKKK